MQLYDITVMSLQDYRTEQPAVTFMFKDIATEDIFVEGPGS